ncbi:MAG: SLC13 family permease, partial [Ilumatobacteraceae bacterium]
SLRLASIFDAGGLVGHARVLLYGVVASDASNNLPAVLAGEVALRARSQVWPLLLGANVGPVLVISGARSGLLWRDTARRMGVQVSARRYSEIGARVGLPALMVAAGVLLLVLV